MEALSDMAYPRYQLDIRVSNGTWNGRPATTENPVVITGIHAGLMVKNGVTVNATFEHHDEDGDTFPHILITFE
jgi:hypothetical protein